MRWGHATLAIAWGIAAILVVATYLVGARLVPNATGGMLAIDRLDKLRDRSVVFIGTSLTMCGVPYDSQFETLAASAGLRLQFVRITQSDATQEDFADVMDRISQSRASLILIEAEMLLRQPDPWHERHGVSALTYSYMAQFRSMWIRLGLGGIGMSANTGNDRDCKLLGKYTTAEDLDRAATWPRLLRTDPWLPSFQALIDSASAGGKKIVVVSFGRSTALEARIDPGYRRRFGSALQRLRAGKKVEVWVFPADRLGSDAYSDGAHLNVKGRAAFTQWLIQQLAADHAGN